MNQYDNYGTCGSNSNCDPLNFNNFKCTCLHGFEPKFPREWYENRDGSGGCVRMKNASVCGNGEGFVKVEGLKVPDTSVAIVKGGLSLKECEKECLRNCSCIAYAVADVRNGGSGCLAWHGDAVELANYYKESKGSVLGKKRMVAILVASVLAISSSSSPAVCIAGGRLKERAWKVWRERNALELIDSSIDNSYSPSEVLRCIQMGLLCVQERAEDRPTMSSVVLMLSSETATMPQPKNPGFCLGRTPMETDSSSSKQDESCSVNQVTVTMLDGR